MRARRSLASGVRICSSKTEGSVPFIPHAFSLFRRQERFFGWRVKRRFVRWMTQAGTRRFDLTALKSRSFFAYGLFFAPSAPLGLDVPLPGGYALQSLQVRRVIVQSLYAHGLP